MVLLEEEEGSFGPFSPLHVLCVVPGRWCRTLALPSLGAEPGPVGALGGSGDGPGSDSFVWMRGNELLFGAPAELAPLNPLFDASVLFCALLHLGQGSRLLLQHLLCAAGALPASCAAAAETSWGQGMLEQPGARRTSALALRGWP